MIVTLLSLLTFVAVTLSLVVGYQFVSNLLTRDAQLVQMRLAKGLRKELDIPEAPDALFKHPDQLTLKAQAPVENLARWELATLGRLTVALRQRLVGLLEQANLPLSARQLLMMSAGLGFLLGAAGTLFRGPLLGMAAASAGGAAPLLFVHLRGQTRREKMFAQLPNAFNLMARVIRSGFSVPQALQAVADAFEGPLAAEFARCQKQQTLGLRPEVTFHEMAQRTGILEMRIFVTAMLIQQQTGGNLSDMLERLANLIRERLRLRRQVKTLTAEGRLQGLTLLVLPLVVFAALMVINRQYAQVLLNHPSLLAATGAAMLVGMLWIRRIVNFDV